MTNAERTYRYDIILILFLGAAGFLTFGAWAMLVTRNSIISNRQYGINTILVYLALLFEWHSFADRKSSVETRDRGVLSATVTLLALVGLPVVENAYSIARIEFRWVYYVGVVLFALGIFLRAAASRRLERMFSHAIVILDDHLLVVEGIYGYVRHPAYLGTLLMVVASAGLWQTYLQVVVAVVVLGLTVARIEREEDMLIDKFGRSYVDYKSRSWRLLPFVY